MSRPTAAQLSNPSLHLTFAGCAVCRPQVSSTVSGQSMGLDVHRLENGRATDRIYSMDAAALKTLSPGFHLFERRTGLAIDPYKDTKFLSGLSNLIEALRDSMPSIPAEAAVFRDLLAILVEAEENGYALVFAGD